MVEFQAFASTHHLMWYLWGILVLTGALIPLIQHWEIERRDTPAVISLVQAAIWLTMALFISPISSRIVGIDIEKQWRWMATVDTGLSIIVAIICSVFAALVLAAFLPSARRIQNRIDILAASMLFSSVPVGLKPTAVTDLPGYDAASPGARAIALLGFQTNHDGFYEYSEPEGVPSVRLTEKGTAHALDIERREREADQIEPLPDHHQRDKRDLLRGA